MNGDDKCKCGFPKVRHGPSGQCPVMRENGVEIMAGIVQKHFWAIYCYHDTKKFTPPTPEQGA